MNNKKNIERFFQEKFKDFEVNPEPQAWANISERINKKKNKKRVFPFWLTSFGIAASLIIGYFLFNEFSSENSNKLIENNSTIVHSESTKTQDENSKLNKNNSENQAVVVATNVVKASENLENLSGNESNLNSKNEALANANDSKTEIQNSSDKNKINTNSPKSTTNNYNKQVLASSSDKKIKNNQKLIQNNVSENENEIVSNKKEKTNQKLIQNNISENENAIVSNKNEKTNQKLIQNNISENKNAIVLNKKDKTNQKLTQNNISENEIVSNKKENSDSNEKENIKSNLEKNNLENSNQLNNKNLIAATKTEDLSKKEVLTENPLDKILKEKESKTLKKAIASNLEKWTIRPNIAPIFMKAFAGSPIHDIFKDNEKDFENQLSIGLAADYAITKKISIRAGINKFDLAYNTNDIAFYTDPTLTTASLNTINFRPETQTVIVGDRKARGAATTASPTPIAENGTMNQSVGYLEFPVEVSYKLIDKKFGMKIITGFSTLLLNNNEVSLNSDSRKIVLGDANNLNNVHYSTNFGIGFKYSFWKSFEANIEPTVKYQIDTFSYDSGGFNPYFLGIYTGISYRL